MKMSFASAEAASENYFALKAENDSNAIGESEVYIPPTIREIEEMMPVDGIYYNANGETINTYEEF